MKARMDKNKCILKWLIMKLQNIKDTGKIVKASREKKNDFRLIADL